MRKVLISEQEAHLAGEVVIDVQEVERTLEPPRDFEEVVVDTVKGLTVSSFYPEIVSAEPEVIIFEGSSSYHVTGIGARPDHSLTPLSGESPEPGSLIIVSMKTDGSDTPQFLLGDQDLDWIELYSVLSSGFHRYYVWYRVAGENEPSTYTLYSTHTVQCAIGMEVWSSLSSEPIRGVEVFERLDSQQSSMPVPAIVPDVTHCQIIRLIGLRRNASLGTVHLSTIDDHEEAYNRGSARNKVGSWHVIEQVDEAPEVTVTASTTYLAVSMTIAIR